MTRGHRRRGEREGAAGPSCEERERVTLADLSGDSPLAPPADVHETADGLVIRMELPGIAPADVEVWVRGTSIEVVAEKKPDRFDAETSYICMERSFGRFRRVFEISGCLNRSLLTAVMSRGVLVISLPKVKERRGGAQRIPVETVGQD